MTTAKIVLTDAEGEVLRDLARRTGKTEEQLLREAVDQLLVRSQPEARREVLQRACGIWKDRRDLPTLEQLRPEWERC